MIKRASTVGLLSLCLIAACASPEPSSPPNLLLISVDTLRQDHLGCYGYSAPTSPNIDRLAARGVVFDNAVSTSSWTLPAHGSMLTGRYPEFHGLREDGVKLAADIPTLAGTLGELGYHATGVVSHVYVSSSFDLDRGFDAFDDSMIREGQVNPRAGQVVDRFLDSLGEDPPRPFFGFVHFFDPHWDYDPPPPFDTRFTDPDYRGPIDGTQASLGRFDRPDRPMPANDLRQLIGYYDGEIAYLDQELGRLLETLDERGLMDDTVVVITADHGEEFKEHGLLGHGRTLFTEQLRVPLIVAGHPAFPAGTRRDDLASAVDVASTLLELAGTEPAPGMQGRSLVTPPAEGERTVYAESIRLGVELRAARQSSVKLLHELQGDRRTFFDLAADRWEQRPLTQDPTGGRLSAALAEFAAEADSGWHLKLISLTDDELRCRGTIRVEGRLVNPRRYFAAQINPGKARFETFETDDDSGTLVFDATIRYLMGEIAFETDPADAPVTFELEVTGKDERVGTYFADGSRIDDTRALTLERSDPRLTAPRRRYWETEPGFHLRAVASVTGTAPKAELSDALLERLRALGYAED